jgi:hypothetical protein
VPGVAAGWTGAISTEPVPIASKVVGVAAVVDVEDVYLVPLFVDPVAHTVFAAPRPP